MQFKNNSQILLLIYTDEVPTRQKSLPYTNIEMVTSIYSISMEWTDKNIYNSLVDKRVFKRQSWVREVREVHKSGSGILLA